ncbi:hypothetical protein ISN45_Aa08g007410 [Arabidopsis thaliana x Arabidopsis arenosa]|uniref:Uncharacterized protein n=1 Tax=Arabidopsis thaliana x Arabidopsis arenosa TaxID=1240361 RepID=A0A8T1XFR2_9BRAS|nr:hypothetical protein ISN45_Aa08g007410 [Arabidopsis thaliana x Arabidopsis arenosa]
MSNLPSEIREYEVEDLEAFMGEETEPHIQTGDGFDLHPQSQSTVDSLNDLRRLCHIPPEVEMVVPKPYESPESGREGYCCAYEIYFKGCGLFFPLPEILLVYLNHLRIAFSQMSPNMLRYLMCTFTVAAEAGYLLGLSELLEFFQARESRTSGYYALYPIAYRNLIDGLPLKDNAWRKFWFFFRIDNFSVQSSSELLRFRWSSNLGPQIRPVPSVDFLNFYKAVLERPVNWNSFTLERIHGAGHSVRMGLTHPVDPPPAEIDLSSLNARDRRRIREADKNVKDQIGKNKKNASSTGNDKIYRKTLLVDDGSLEGSKSMAVTINNAPPSTPAADNLVAATAEEEGLTGDSSSMKKRKVEKLKPPLQGRPRSTRKDRAAPSNLSIPESAEAQDDNHDSGIVLKEPLGSGMLPPQTRLNPHINIFILDKEKIGNMFRCFHTRFGKKLPSFERWRPDIKKMYISHSFHSSQATLDVNGIINYYEEELAKVSKKAAVAEGEIEKLQSSSRPVQETAGLDSARQEEIKRLERSGEETKKNLTETEQKLKNALADHGLARGEIELLKSELSKVKTVAEELERKNESLSALKDQDVRKISHDARKEVKGAEQKFLLAVQEFISADKAWNKLKSERDEMKSNLDLIKEIEEGTVNLAEEKETVGAELAETEAKLATAPQPYLDLQQFASEFADSPPLTEPNTGRTQGFPGQDLTISSIMGDDFESRSEPPQGTSSLNPEVVLTAQDANVGDAPISSQVGDKGDFFITMASPQGEPSDLNPPRFSSGESLFPSGDGFTPHGWPFLVFFLPCLRKKRSSATNSWNRSPKGTFSSAPKGNALAGNAASLRTGLLELKGRSDVWSRMFITGRGGDLTLSLAFPAAFENISGNSSENPSDSFRVISDDLPGALDIELIKAGGTGEPEESQILRKGTSIQVPIVLIERLSAQDRIKADEFINKLIIRHDELEDEKKEIRKRIRELEKRRLDIARELHRLEAHPSDWIELGLQEYGNMAGCIMSIVDLAGQGAELFRNSRPF